MTYFMTKVWTTASTWPGMWHCERSVWWPTSRPRYGLLPACGQVCDIVRGLYDDLLHDQGMDYCQHVARYVALSEVCMMAYFMTRVCDIVRGLCHDQPHDWGMWHYQRSAWWPTLWPEYKMLSEVSMHATQQEKHCHDRQQALHRWKKHKHKPEKLTWPIHTHTHTHTKLTWPITTDLDQKSNTVTSSKQHHQCGLSEKRNWPVTMLHGFDTADSSCC